MIEKLKRISLLVVAAVWMVACGGDKHANVVPVPAQASSVAVVKLKSLMGKASYEQLSQLEGFRAWEEEMKNGGEDDQKIQQLMTGVLKDPKSSGVNMEQDVYIYTLSLEKKERYMGISFGVSDPKNLKASLEKTGMKFDTKKGYEVSLKDAGILLFNENRGLMLLASTVEAEAKLDDRAFDYIALKEEASLGANEDFMAFVKEVQDMGLCASLTSLTDGAGMTKTQLESFGMKEQDLASNTFRLFVDFKQGELVFRLDRQMNAGFMAGMKPIAGENLGAEVFKYLPAEHLIGFFGYSINFKNLFANADEAGKKVEMMKQQLDMAKGAMAVAGLSPERLDEMLSGKLLLAITDVRMVTRYNGTQRPDPIYLAALGVKDPKGLDALLEKLGVSLQKEGKISTLANSPLGALYFTYVDQYLLASNERSLIEKISTGTPPAGQPLPQSLLKLASAPLCGYVNLSPDRLSENGKKWDDFGRFAQAAGIDHVALDNTGKQVELHIRFTDANTSSLISLFKTADGLKRQQQPA
ncbi:MAG: DUF4836 family protein [Sphingobacteriia bacterium]